MNEKKPESVNLTENQLMQIAQQEQDALNNTEARIRNTTSWLTEALAAKEILKERKKSEGKVLVSVGATVLIELEAKKTTKCKRGISENGYVEEEIDQTITWLEKREQTLRKQLEALQKEYNESQNRLTTVIGILKQIEAEKRKQTQKAKEQPVTISK
jgi:prefoldin subunit 5